MMSEKIQWVTNQLMDAMHAHDKIAIMVWKDIKAEFLNFEKSGNGKNLDDAECVKIYKKLQQVHFDSYTMYSTSPEHKVDAEQHQLEYEYITKLIPAAASEEEIARAIERAISSGISPEKKNMKMFMDSVKMELPNAEGKTIAALLKSKLA